MTVYLDGVFLLNFMVDFLLLLAAGRLCGYPVKIGRAMLSALLGGFYGGCCLLPEFYFLGNLLWRMVFLGIMALIAFGLSKSALRRGLVFAFLSFALGGAVLGLEQGGVLGIVWAAGVLCFLCFFGFRGRIGGTSYVPVELSYGDKRVKFIALRDTGNTLRDPITGRDVLVVGADVAEELTGLTREQLISPVESLGTLEGLRLMPYRTVNNGSGFLLALRMQDVIIGKRRGNSLVAFAPEKLSPEGAYQGLTGGMV